LNESFLKPFSKQNKTKQNKTKQNKTKQKKKHGILAGLRCAYPMQNKKALAERSN
jgi:hypothetical protein